jgi:hypothetical protein
LVTLVRGNNRLEALALCSRRLVIFARGN